MLGLIWEASGKNLEASLGGPWGLIFERRGNQQIFCFAIFASGPSHFGTHLGVIVGVVWESFGSHCFVIFHHFGVINVIARFFESFLSPCGNFGVIWEKC